MRFVDPFKNPLDQERKWVNPYLKLMAENPSSEMPLAIHFGSSLKDMRGFWRQRFFPEVSGLILEIGCHFGKSFVEMAADHPEVGFIGADITFKRVVSTAQKVRRLRLANARCILLDGRFLEQVFAEGELKGVVVFFPDPWNKKAQQKHRLLNGETLAKIFRSIQKGGFFWLKTDCENYFQEVVQSVAPTTAKKIGCESQFFKRDYTSTFERHCLADQRPIFSQVFEIT